MLLSLVYFVLPPLLRALAPSARGGRECHVNDANSRGEVHIGASFCGCGGPVLSRAKMVKDGQTACGE